MSAIADSSVPVSRRFPPRTLGDRSATVEPRHASQFQPLTVRQNFSWCALANVVTAACGWGRLILLARLGNAEMIGQVVLAFAVSNPIASLADLGLSGSLVTDAKGEYRFRHYLGLRLITAVAILIVVTGTACLGGYSSRAAGLITLAGLATALESVSDILQAWLQKHERMDFVAVSLLLRGPLGLTLLALCTWWSGDLLWGMWGFPVAAAISLLLLDWPNAQRSLSRMPLATEWERVGVRAHDRQNALPAEPFARAAARLAWVSAPLGIATASIVLAGAIPRYAIHSYLGAAALGGFAVAGGFMLGSALIANAVGQAIGPRLAQYHAAGELSAFCRLLGKALAAIATFDAGLTLALVLLGKPLLWACYGPQFTHYAQLAVCLMLVALVKDLGAALGRALSAMRRFRTNMAIRMAGILVLFATLPAFVPTLGLNGAAAAMMSGWFCTTVISSGVVLAACVRQRASPIAIPHSTRSPSVADIF
ncbi:MAG: oligosaccharide flippase family protein [Thermoguttaceae bacterium]|jgi:O-antigen/teichoic acid export membrane protein